MKKRYDDGYVLVYVVVVIVILSILVPAACANSLRNLKAQQASVERMQQLYEAEGQIERFVAEIEAVQNTTSVSGTGRVSLTENPVGAAERAVEAVMEGAPAGVLSGKLKKGVSRWDWENEPNSACWGISLVSEAEGITISAAIRVDMDVEITVNPIYDEGEPQKITDYSWSYNITSCTITYDSYDISASTETENTGEEAGDQS